jgi:putative transposase
MVNPATVTAWHYKGFRLFWTWKSRHGQPGRPAVSLEVLQLIRRMSRENPLWGASKIHGELLKLGFEISETSVSKYLVRRKGPPSQSWLDRSGFSNCRLPVFAGIPVNPSTHIADINFL